MVANVTESLYSMINLDRVQDDRPLHLKHPTPCHGRSTVAGGKVLGASVSPQDRNLWRLRAVTKVTAGNMSNCRFGRCDSRRSFFGSLGKGLTSIAAISQIFYPGKVLASANSPEPLSEVEEWFKKIKGSHRIVYDAPSIHEGFPIIWSWVFLDASHSSGSTDEDLTSMVVFRHNAFALALNDDIWSSFKLGKFLKISDPLTGVPAAANPSGIHLKALWLTQACP